MLERAEKKTDFSKKEYKQMIKPIKDELATLQLSVNKADLPVIIIFEGFGAAGKGDITASLISELDPRFFNVKSNLPPNDEETSKPFLFRYWRDIPSRGTISILDRSWYQETVSSLFDKKLSKKQLEKRINSINTFERQLTDDGYLIIKIFLHIEKKEQQKRFAKLLESDRTSWRVTEKDLKRNKHYDEYSEAFDTVLEKTSSNNAPWHIVSSADKQYAKLEVLKLTTKTINAKLLLGANCTDGVNTIKPLKPTFTLVPMPELSEIDLSKSISDEKYDKELEKEQKKLSELQNIILAKEFAVTIAFEGWDAAGKGGAIRRISSALDPRGYDAIPVSAPQGEEKTKHYLWRFWKNAPPKSFITIFDRTWYGRVLVENVEGFTSKERCEQAYQEINEFEYELSQSGIVLIKFWLHIDKDEQERRFSERQNTPEKQWKITNEDWRNRDKWDEYELAVNEMLKKTSTDFSPWKIIEGNDKKYARIKILKTINKALEEALKD